jgi:hypothetical protein
MLRATSQESKKRTVRFPGIVADAKALGVTRQTLWRVLTGEWQSRSLLRRYEALKGHKR